MAVSEQTQINSTFEPANLAPWKVTAEVHRGAMFWNSEMQVARGCSKS